MSEMVRFNQSDAGILMICALRYCHGRRTYMPKLVQSIVMGQLPGLSDRDIHVISNDLNSMTESDYGDPVIDRKDWIKFRDAVEEEMERRRHEQNEIRLRNGF